MCNWLCEINATGNFRTCHWHVEFCLLWHALNYTSEVSNETLVDHTLLRRDMSYEFYLILHILNVLKIWMMDLSHCYVYYSLLLLSYLTFILVITLLWLLYFDVQYTLLFKISNLWYTVGQNDETNEELQIFLSNLEII